MSAAEDPVIAASSPLAIAIASAAVELRAIVPAATEAGLEPARIAAIEAYATAARDALERAFTVARP